MKPQSPQGRVTSGEFVAQKRRILPVAPAPATQTQQNHTAQRLDPLETPKPTNKRPFKKRWKKLKKRILAVWKPTAAIVLATLVVGAVFVFRLGTLHTGVSASEQAYIASVDSGKELLSNPVFLVHKLPTYLLFKLGAESAVYYRLVSAAIGFLAVISCYYLLKRWYTVRVALIASWLLMTSAWLLHITRLATPDASLLLLMPLLWGATWMYTTERRQYALTALIAVGVGCLYVPGFLWLLIGAVIWQHKLIAAEIKKVSLWFIIVASLGIIVGLFPLVYGAIQEPRHLLLLAGLPEQLPQLNTIWQNLLSIPKELLFRGPSNPERWLGRMPLLDIFTTVMMFMGIYAQRYQVKLIRAQLLAIAAVLFGVLIALGGPVTTTALLPVVYLLVAGGIAFFLSQWFTVFPKNPFARTIGTLMLLAVVGLTSMYHVRHYFVAWPQTPVTRETFDKSLIK